MTHEDEGYKGKYFNIYKTNDLFISTSTTHFFTVVALKHRSDRSTWHQLFIKEHSNKKRSDPDLPLGKTLFVLNVPPYVQAEHLSAGFATAGEVSHVVLADRKGNRFDLPNPSAVASRCFNAAPQTNSFKSAFVVFRSTKALRNALLLNEVLLYRNDRTILVTGVVKWQREHAEALPDEKAIEAEVEQYMDAFEMTEAEQRVAERQQEVDEDGWQTVKKGRGAGFEQKESTLKRLEDKLEEGKKKKELQNFYTFQIRDSKRQHVVGLRKRFENDKRKIESMKQARHFKPY